MSPPQLRRRVRAALLLAVGVLFVISIPWYRRGGEEAELWLGLPDWVAVALVCYGAAAVLNSVAWLLTEIPDDADDESGRQ